MHLDLTTGGRCLGTDSSLGAGLSSVRDVLSAAGVEVALRKVHIQSEQQARAWRFRASPTIRINGSDIPLEQRESRCGAEPCTDGCGDHIECRVWVFDGREHTVPPAALIVDAVLRHAYADSPEPGGEPPYELPDSLRRFFAGRSATVAAASPVTVSDCCSAAEQESCCDGAKVDCCAEGQGCGCR